MKFGTKSGKILQKNRALWLINEDFEWAAENLVHDLSGYDIITNLPYGKMSSENDNSVEKKKRAFRPILKIRQILAQKHENPGRSLPDLPPTASVA